MRMNTTDEQRENIIQSITEVLRTNGFTFEYVVRKNPKGIRIIHEVTKEQLDAIMRTAAKEHRQEKEGEV